ncbi:hypothetical protein [Thalassospira xiamenensis]|jgi:hypothetical protein|uniref:hypothetical protein n=1 Tax=Thalassospira xiamenensis TaxID=220697 RepID=UPI000DED7F4A|nr:hypothetical protein [Thalassospira xiamenensis]RCK37260.1 hypothetical protein TH24_16935 [Thalassospira xiamenensis]
MDYIAGFFNELYQIKYAFSTGVYTTLGPPMLTLLRSGSSLYVTLIAVMMIAQPQKGKERAEGLAYSILAVIAAIFLLNQTGGQALVLSIFWAIEDMSLAIAIEMLRKLPTYGQAFALPYPIDTATATIQVGGETIVNGYAVLASLIEAQMFDVLEMMSEVAYGNGSLITPGTVVRVIMAIIGMLPFIFVLGIFAAFMAEAMFKYVAMSTAAPILIALFPFKFFRPFSTAAIRILIGAFFTIVFAAGAMGFTMVAVGNLKDDVSKILSASRSNATSTPSYEVWCGKGTAFALPRDAFGQLTFYNKTHPKMIAEKMTEAECSEADELASAGDWVVFKKPFLILIVIGFLSVLLHLSAKTLASNISGANDGPGPAAAVVMAAKTAALGGAGMAMRYGSGALFGQGGAGSSISSLMNKSDIGQNFHNHGLVGGAASLFNPFKGSPPNPRGGDSGGGSFGNIGSDRFSAGGSSGSMMGSQKEQQQFADMMSKSFTQALRNSGIGRDRNGS